jgi:hypothetical protein
MTLILTLWPFFAGRLIYWSFRRYFGDRPHDVKLNIPVPRERVTPIML